jgi:hypothetical protein
VSKPLTDGKMKDQVVNMESLNLVTSSISFQQKRCSGGIDTSKLSDHMKQIEDSLRRVTNDVEHLKRLQKDKTEKQIEKIRRRSSTNNNCKSCNSSLVG